MRLWIDGHEVLVRTFRFPGGEMQVRIEDAGQGTEPRTTETRCVRIHADLRGSDDVMTLLMLTDAARRQYPGAHVDLVCPYLPYARQDRVAFPGEALSIAVLCKVLNAQDYASVEVWDAHSDVSLALLDRVLHRPATDFARKAVAGGDIIVAPDQGAVKRATAVARQAGARLVTASKVRSTDTGEITGTEVHCSHVGDSDFLIVDDICDGGRTFIELAKALRPLTNGLIRLYVTHGIFSAGFEEMERYIDQILVANPFPSNLPAFVQAI